MDQSMNIGTGEQTEGCTTGQLFKTKHIETYWPYLPIVTLEPNWIDYVSVCESPQICR